MPKKNKKLQAQAALEVRWFVLATMSGLQRLAVACRDAGVDLPREATGGFLEYMGAIKPDVDMPAQYLAVMEQFYRTGKMPTPESFMPPTAAGPPPSPRRSGRARRR